MAGIYIPGMEMPTKCINCRLMRRCGQNDLDYVCMPARIYVEDLINAYKPRPDYCPLIPVPDHGRLIDADNLDYITVSIDKRGCVSKIDAPTIIPAEEGAE